MASLFDYFNNALQSFVLIGVKNDEILQIC